MKNGIVIPCYNESTRLQLDEFANFVDYHKDYVLCFVNDGSKDNTVELLNNFRKGKEDNVLVLDLNENQGKAEAVRRGILHLLEQTEAENVGFIDADLSTGFQDYRMLVSNLMYAEKDPYMVFGSRKIEGEGDIDRSLFRDIASNVVGVSIRMILGLPISDTQCGAKVFTRSMAQRVFSEGFLTRWLFDVEIFLRMKKIFGKDTIHKMKEIPITAWTDIDGSKLTFKDSLKIPFMLYKIAFNYASPFNNTWK